LCQQPCERQLRRGAALFGGERADGLDDPQVGFDVVPGEARIGPPEVLRIQLLAAADASREESPAERAVGEEGGADVAARGEHALLRISRPQRILALDRGDGVQRRGPLQRSRRHFGQADRADLALLHQIGERADRILERRLLEIEPMDVVQVDRFDLQAPERRVAGRANVRG
jgi:hypothetical protein